MKGMLYCGNVSHTLLSASGRAVYADFYEKKPPDYSYKIHAVSHSSITIQTTQIQAFMTPASVNSSYKHRKFMGMTVHIII